jgi:hypothetical protein
MTMAQHVIRVLGRRGDAPITFDPKAPAEVDAARAVFDRLMGKGHAAFADYGDGVSTRVKEFDPHAVETTIIAPVQGG